MNDLDDILSNSAMNASFLTGYCLVQFSNYMTAHSYWGAAIAMLAAGFCMRDVIDALTYKH